MKYKITTLSYILYYKLRNFNIDILSNLIEVHENEYTRNKNLNISFLRNIFIETNHL